MKKIYFLMYHDDITIYYKLVPTDWDSDKLYIYPDSVLGDDLLHIKKPYFSENFNDIKKLSQKEAYRRFRAQYLFLLNLYKESKRYSDINNAIPTG